MSTMESKNPAPGAPVVRKKDSTQFVGFRLAEQEYAFRIEQIQEIVIPRQVTCTPQVPSYVEGVSNLRGTIIPIINLRCLFGLESSAPNEDTRTIVVNVGERTMGCTVDAVTQVMRIPADRIQRAPEVIATDRTAYITGFARLDDRILVILNIDELLDPDKLDEVRKAALDKAPLPQL